MKFFPAILLAFMLISFDGSAQIGGRGVYKFLDLPKSARSASLGGQLITMRDGDINLVADNPSVLDSTMEKHATLTYINYISDINFGYVGYARKVKKLGMFSGGLQYVNYGKFTEADETGVKTGNFSAGEYALNVSHARPIDSLFQVGATMKMIYSSLYRDNSLGLALDLGANYLSKSKNFSAGIVARNIGTQITAYRQGNREPLPFNVQLGISNRVKHAPFRVSLFYNHLEKWDLTYDNPNAVDEDQNSASEEGSSFFTVDKLLRHLVIGTEFLPHKHFNLRLAYHFQRRKEMALTDRSGMTGFSFGAMLKVRRLYISYALASYHLAGASNHITISTNLSQWGSTP